jgi:hypothetical protein
MRKEDGQRKEHLKFHQSEANLPVKSNGNRGSEEMHILRREIIALNTKDKERRREREGKGKA